MSPVLMLKQAPCQGQRSLSPLKTPAIENPPTSDQREPTSLTWLLPLPGTSLTFAEWGTLVGALAAQGAELLLVPHQQHRVASHHHLPEPVGEVGAPWSRGSMPRSQQAAPSTNNMAAANMAATNMAAVAMATPPLLACRPHGGGPGPSLPTTVPSTHSPSPMSSSLQTSAVTVSSLFMLVAAGEHREGMSATDAAFWICCLLPLGRQSSPCTLVPSLQNPTPKYRATTAPAGSRSVPCARGVPNSRYRRKKTHNWQKTQLSPLFRLRLQAQSPFLWPFLLWLNPCFCIQPRVPLNSTAARGERGNVIYSSHVVSKRNYLQRGAASVACGSPKLGSEELLQPLQNLSNICADMLFALIPMKAVIPAQNVAWARKQLKKLGL